MPDTIVKLDGVSIHSRLKAAGHNIRGRVSRLSFNTQPPEGGCKSVLEKMKITQFQYTAA